LEQGCQIHQYQEQEFQQLHLLVEEEVVYNAATEVANGLTQVVQVVEQEEVILLDNCRRFWYS
jgi:3-phosphoglycerate kinase